MYIIEHEIDGEVFMELSENDIQQIVIKIGIVKKILRLRAQFSASHQVLLIHVN